MTNAQPKNKMLVIIIAILLIANIATLSFFLLNRNERQKAGRTDRKGQITEFLKKNVGFSDEQLSRYDTLSRQHRSKMRMILDSLGPGREDIFRNVASQSFSDSAISAAAAAIADQQKAFETKMLRHLKDIRNICTPAQQQVFDTGFYKIISRRGDPKKDKKTD